MAKLYQTLEQVFKMRINSNAEIIPYIKKLSEMGKFDEPKKVAALAILLDRVGKMEDDIDIEKSLSEIVTPEPENQSTPQVETVPSPSSEVPATTETSNETNPVDPEKTVSTFTPENITDPVPSTPDSTTP